MSRPAGQVVTPALGELGEAAVTNRVGQTVPNKVSTHGIVITGQGSYHEGRGDHKFSSEPLQDQIVLSSTTSFGPGLNRLP